MMPLPLGCRGSRAPGTRPWGSPTTPGQVLLLTRWALLVCVGRGGFPCETWVRGPQRGHGGLGGGSEQGPAPTGLCQSAPTPCYAAFGGPAYASSSPLPTWAPSASSSVPPYWPLRGARDKVACQAEDGGGAWGFRPDPPIQEEARLRSDTVGACLCIIISVTQTVRIKKYLSEGFPACCRQGPG